MRGVTIPMDSIINWKENISTHTPHARRDLRHELIHAFFNISTHTPHARRDRKIYITLLFTPQHVGGQLININ